MVEQATEKRIQLWKIQWRVARLFQLIAISLGLSLVITTIITQLLSWTSFWTAVMFFSIFLLAFILGSLKSPFWKINALSISRYLDARFPELEESTGLLLKSSA